MLRFTEIAKFCLILRRLNEKRTGYFHTYNSPIKNVVFSIFVMGLLNGCLEVENQKLASPTTVVKLNPVPTIKNPKISNDRHKVLIAILDTGVDYNHPSIARNIHFDLNEKEEAVGAGYDFIGEDRWPAPYLARTFDLDVEAPEKQKLRSSIVRKMISKFVRYENSLLPKVDPDRSVEAETAFMHHGTHVAGLASYDNPEIGLLPYRVLPVNANYLKGESSKAQAFTKSVEQVRAGTQDALKKGARVINMSLSFDADDAPSELRGKFSEWKQEFALLAKSRPDVVFVAAAGNEQGKFVSLGGPRFPCGTALENVLCVTAANRDETTVAKFSNIVDDKLLQIMAPGEDILSTFPSGICQSDLLKNYMAENVFEITNEFVLRNLAADLKKDCQKPPFIRESGTSMAAPIVSHAIAEILISNLSLSGKEVIRVLLNKSPDGKLKINKPSWYAANPEL